MSGLLAREEWMHWRHSPRYEVAMARTRLEHGDTVSASRHAARLRELSIRDKAGKYLAIALEILAEVALVDGDVAAAEADVGAALQVLDRTPHPSSRIVSTRRERGCVPHSTIPGRAKDP